MRLINTNTLQLLDFPLEVVPRYAILSHTWDDAEVTFSDMSLPTRSTKKGFQKILKTCQLASSKGLEYAWVDTCCIDKSSSAELTESINSMFNWYSRAEVCIVYLKDFHPDTKIDDLTSCIWFSRGWTLQELIAPARLEFYDSEWRMIGSKFDFTETISATTHIPSETLLSRHALKYGSVAQKMSWAACRTTTRIEDMAYSLLGIFDVNMPLLYGEGVKAFRRLQEEIIKHRNDLSIFAWNSTPDKEFICLLAKSPETFAQSSGIHPFSDDFADFSITNKGLLISGDVPLRSAIIKKGYNTFHRYALFLGSDLDNSDTDGAIYLRKVGPGLFYRDGTFPLAGFWKNDPIDIFDVGDNYVYGVADNYILMDPDASQTTSSMRSFRDGAIDVPPGGVFELKNKSPEILWDITDRVFLRPKPYEWTRYPMVLAMEFSGTIEGTEVNLVVLCDYRQGDPKCGIFNRDTHQRDFAMIFQGRYRSESMFWADLEFQAPDLLLLNDKTEISIGGEVFTVSVTVERGHCIVDSIPVQLHDLKLNLHQQSSGSPMSDF